jgi:hypothetical protein
MAPAQSLAEIRPAPQSRTLTVLLALLNSLTVVLAGRRCWAD